MSGAEEGGVSEQDLHEQLLPSSEGEDSCPHLLPCPTPVQLLSMLCLQGIKQAKMLLSLNTAQLAGS